MKRVAVICILILFVQYSMQIPKYENCDRQVLSGDSAKDCVRVICKNSKEFEIRSCDTVMCPKNKQIGYHNGDPNEEHPACCSYPICKK